jgi:hypothetical protein
MSPERNDRAEEHEQDLYEDVPPRSIFAATWFRVVLVVIVLGVIGAVAVPYALDWMNPPPSSRSASAAKSPLLAVPTPAAPTTDEKIAAKSPGESRSDKKDSMLVPAPAPVTPPLAAAPARPEAKSDPKSSDPKSSAKPASQAKSSAKATPDAKSAAPDAKIAAADAKASTPPTETKTAMAVTDGSAKSAAAKTPAKPDPAAKSETTPATATKPAPVRQAAARATPPSTSGAVGGAPYWVQVGAFKDPETAKHVAAKLRDENFKVEESVKRLGPTAPAAAAPAVKPSPAPTGTDQYDVFVTGMSVEDLNRRLAGKGLTGEATSGGVVVKPSLPLRDAVALSKDLAVEGFKVQVRRAGGAVAAPPAPATAAAPTEGGRELHRVRVGSFADRAAAQAAARELEAKGYKPYIARGDQ